MLADDSLSASESADATDRPVGDRPDQAATGPAYANTVGHDGGRRVVDLLPHGRVALTLAILAALMSVGLLSAVDIWSPSIGTLLGDPQLEVLRLDAQRGIAPWLASMLLAGCAPLAWLIYSLRRHRVDDYNGRYRVWLWIGLASLVGSMLESSDLGLLLKAACRRACGVCSLEATAVWNSCGALLLVAAALRLLIEVRHSRPAIAAWTASGVALVLSTAMVSPWLEIVVTAFPPAARACWLVGYVFFLATLLLYVRFVRLQIEGVVALPKRVRKVRVKTAQPDHAETPAKPRAALQLRTDLDPAPAATHALRHSPTATANHDRSDEDSTLSVESHSGSGLSRAERRRMRRQTRGAA